MAEIMTEKQGEWCEIEPGVWFEFWPMPLSDDDAIDRWLCLKAGIQATACLIKEYTAEIMASYQRSQRSKGDVPRDNGDLDEEMPPDEQELTARKRADVARLQSAMSADGAGDTREKKVHYWRDLIHYLELHSETLFAELPHYDIWYRGGLCRAGLLVDDQPSDLANREIKAMAESLMPQIRETAHQRFLARKAQEWNPGKTIDPLNVAPDISERLHQEIDWLPKIPKPKKAPKQTLSKSMF